MTPAPIHERLALGLFILRITLGIFLLQWGLEKFLTPQVTVAIFGYFYGLEISATVSYVLGALQCLIAAAVIVGFLRRYSYGAAFLIHLVSVASTWRSLIDPFGLIFENTNHLFMTGVPVLAGFWLIYYLRDFDRRSLDARGDEFGVEAVN